MRCLLHIRHYIAKLSPQPVCVLKRNSLNECLQNTIKWTSKTGKMCTKTKLIPARRRKASGAETCRSETTSSEQNLSKQNAQLFPCSSTSTFNTDKHPVCGVSLVGPLCALQQLLTTRIRMHRSPPETSSGTFRVPPTRFCSAPVCRKWVFPSATFLRMDILAAQWQNNPAETSVLPVFQGTAWCAASLG